MHRAKRSEFRAVVVMAWVATRFGSHDRGDGDGKAAAHPENPVTDVELAALEGSPMLSRSLMAIAAHRPSESCHAADTGHCRIVPVQHNSNRDYLSPKFQIAS
jgi:hypothetical protein